MFIGHDTGKGWVKIPGLFKGKTMTRKSALNRARPRFVGTGMKNDQQSEPHFPGPCPITVYGKWVKQPPRAGGAAQAAWRHTPGGLIDAGFASEIPSFDAIKAGLPPPELSSAAPALVLWAHVFGARAGDTVTLTITGPDRTLIDERITLDRTQARLFRAAGKRLTASAWPGGLYTGTATLSRGVTALGSRSVSIVLAP